MPACADFLPAGRSSARSAVIVRSHRAPSAKIALLKVVLLNRTSKCAPLLYRKSKCRSRVGSRFHFSSEPCAVLRW